MIEQSLKKSYHYYKDVVHSSLIQLQDTMKPIQPNISKHIKLVQTPVVMDAPCHHHNGGNISRAYCPPRKREKKKQHPSIVAQKNKCNSNPKGANERPLCKMKANPFHPLPAHLLLSSTRWMLGVWMGYETERYRCIERGSSPS